jgi:Uma2 family endonuclease
MLEFMLDLDLLAAEKVLPRRPLSRRAYDKLVERGVFEDERIELLRGRLVTLSPQGSAHATVTARLAQRLIHMLDLTYDVRSHSPYAATDDSEPEPDISVSRRKKRGHYHPSKALLLVEVSESSLRKDRLLKAAIYAENRAPEYWIVALSTRSVFVHTDPARGEYRSVARLGRGDVLRPRLLPGIEIPVADVFAAR